MLQLQGQGLSYNQIIERTNRSNKVQINVSQISFWVRGLQHPLGNVNKFNSRPAPTLAYIIGVRLSDGYVYRHRYSYEFRLNSIDYEFTAETGRSLAKLLGRKEPYRPWWDKWGHRWRVKCCSVLLCRFLDQSWQNLSPYIEHCKDCIAAFLCAFFDGEGSVNGR